jgi:hypothetical protein
MDGESRRMLNNFHIAALAWMTSCWTKIFRGDCKPFGCGVDVLEQAPEDEGDERDDPGN